MANKFLSLKEVADLHIKSMKESIQQVYDTEKITEDELERLAMMILIGGSGNVVLGDNITDPINEIMDKLKG
ncbi:MAG: hypothetical protein GY928_21200 [Colwellia sp.]|nr:hypothetical protein [Colwellia sp.]